jgi:DNA-directed RNA polymerase subunit M/transcription elongation factor TFIIS
MSSAKFAKAPKKFRIGVIVGIERGLLNAAVVFTRNKNKIASWTLRDFVNIYTTKRNLLFTMISDMDNSPMGNIILNKTVAWCLLAHTSVYELRPDIYLPLTKRINMQKAVVLKQKFIEGMYRCRNCGSTKFKEKTMQTRASDEAASLFAICAGCGKRSDGMKSF